MALQSALSRAAHRHRVHHGARRSVALGQAHPPARTQITAIGERWRSGPDRRARSKAGDGVGGDRQAIGRCRAEAHLFCAAEPAVGSWRGDHLFDGAEDQEALGVARISMRTVAAARNASWARPRRWSRWCGSRPGTSSPRRRRPRLRSRHPGCGWRRCRSPAMEPTPSERVRRRARSGSRNRMSCRRPRRPRPRACRSAPPKARRRACRRARFQGVRRHGDRRRRGGLGLEEAEALASSPGIRLRSETSLQSRTRRMAPSACSRVALRHIAGDHRHLRPPGPAPRLRRRGVWDRGPGTVGPALYIKGSVQKLSGISAPRACRTRATWFT